MLADLLERRKEMDVRQHYRRRRQDERHRHVEWVRKQPGRVYIGMDCTTLADRHIKYVHPHSAYWPYTAGELARIYLTDLLRSYGTDRVCDHYKLTERDAALMGIQAPLYFEPERGREGTFVYIDINACYWQLWHRLPLNLAFDPASGVTGKPRPGLLIPQADYAWLGAEKELRNAMFGMMSGHHIEWWANGKPQRHEMLGAFAAPGLAAYVRTTLRQIARVAIEEFGCRMWLTDAGIFEASQGMAFQEWLGGDDGSDDVFVVHVHRPEAPRHARGLASDRVHDRPSARPLHASVKAQGKGHLWGLGNYRIGNLSTRQPKGVERHTDTAGYSNL